MTKEELLVKICPSCLRKGLYIFNWIDENYKVERSSRDVQFIDCFYDDSRIDGY